MPPAESLSTASLALDARYWRCAVLSMAWRTLLQRCFVCQVRSQAVVAAAGSPRYDVSRVSNF
jgi:hypothetical protein